MYRVDNPDTVIADFADLQSRSTVVSEIDYPEISKLFAVVKYSSSVGKVKTSVYPEGDASKLKELLDYDVSLPTVRSVEDSWVVLENGIFIDELGKIEEFKNSVKKGGEFVVRKAGPLPAGLTLENTITIRTTAIPPPAPTKCDTILKCLGELDKLFK